LFRACHPFLAYGPVRAADGDILQRSAEAAHGVPFVMLDERPVIFKAIATRTALIKSQKRLDIFCNEQIP
jgi:hypothetical protein